MKKALHKKILVILALFVVSSSAMLSLNDRTYTFPCAQFFDLISTTVIDVNQTGHYTLMRTVWCDQELGTQFTFDYPIIYSPDCLRGKPINENAEDLLPWMEVKKKPDPKLKPVPKKKPQFIEIHYMTPEKLDVGYTYELFEDNPNVYYTQYLPISDVIDAKSSNGITIKPNPAKSDVSMSFDMAKDNNVSIVLFAQNGQEIARLDNTFRTSGEQLVNFNIAELSNGVYFIKTIIGGQTLVNPLFIAR